MKNQSKNLFISHSPLDSDVLTKIKAEITTRSAGSINIFLSSDGQSIPLGKNWQIELESALQNCGLMLVAVTPRSQDSKWIHFEAGYAYAKNVKVIPIAFDGISIDDLAPPLNRMQGFNLDSASKFKNIIREINETFGLKLSDTIGEPEFNELMRTSSKIANEFYENGVILIRIHVPKSDDWKIGFTNLLRASQADCETSDNRINSYGISIFEIDNNMIEISIDPSTLNKYSDLIDAAIQNASGKNFDSDIYLEYGRQFRELDIPQWISARQQDSEIQIGENGTVYRGCKIEIGHTTNWESEPFRQIRGSTLARISVRNKSIRYLQLDHFMHILSTSGIIYKYGE